jgi:hypothetical protein
VVWAGSIGRETGLAGPQSKTGRGSRLGLGLHAREND